MKVKKKPSNKKVKSDLSNWLSITASIYRKKKKSFSLWNRLRALISKSIRDPETEVCKDIIKALSDRKIALEEAFMMYQSSAKNMESMRGDLGPVLIYLLGGLSMFICSLVFFILRSPHSLKLVMWTSNYTWAFWLFMMLASSIILFIGLKKRNVFQDKLIQSSVLSQSCAAYAASRVPGKGGSLFEAYAELEKIRKEIKSRSPFQIPFQSNSKK